MSTTTSPFLSGFHNYDFSVSLSSGSLWLAFSQPLFGSERLKILYGDVEGYLLAGVVIFILLISFYSTREVQQGESQR